MTNAWDRATGSLRKRGVALTDCVCVHACVHVWVHDICVNVQRVEMFVLLSNII